MQSLLIISLYVCVCVFSGGARCGVLAIEHRPRM